MSKYRCLSYHELGGRQNKYTVEKKMFLRQLNIVKEHNLSFKSLRHINEVNDVDTFMALTFDDGFSSDLWAAEKLVEFGYTGTFFLVESNIKGTNRMYLDETQVKEISAMGHSIGVHGKTHTWWPSKPISVLLHELNDTKKYLQDLTSRDIISCSAVGGKLNKLIISGLYDDLEFKFVRNTIPWFTATNAFEVNSTIIVRNDTERIFLKKARGDLNYYRFLLVKQLLKNHVKRALGR